MRVLIVDDSVVFRSQIKAALQDIEGIVVVGTAANGRIALDRIEQGSIDVVILDLEMPAMTGLEMLQEMRRRGLKQTVIVFAAPSGTGIEAALSALRAGAADFVSKPQASVSLEQALDGVRRELVPKIRQFHAQLLKRAAPSASGPGPPCSPAGPPPEPRSLAAARSLDGFRARVVGVGSSTGGPTALDSIFAHLRGRPLSVPIFIAQHMPPTFTEYLAKRLSAVSGHPAREAQHGEAVVPGTIYVAPGDYHMIVERASDKKQVLIRLDQGPKRNSVRPAVDNLFESLAATYSTSCAAFVLTGMGEDGLVGAKAVKAASGRVIIQDQSSSVVWGMPGAVHNAGAYDRMGSLEDCGKTLAQLSS